eukprot:5045933-Pyramimonas_sp.AAC.1
MSPQDVSVDFVWPIQFWSAVGSGGVELQYNREGTNRLLNFLTTPSHYHHHHVHHHHYHQP